MIMPLVAEPLGYITSVGSLVAIVEGVPVGIGPLDRIAGAQWRLYELPCAWRVDERFVPAKCNRWSASPGELRPKAFRPDVTERPMLVEFRLDHGAQLPGNSWFRNRIYGQTAA